MGGMGDALGQLGQSTGISNIGSGIANLFTGSSQAASPAQVAGATMPSDTLFGMPMPPPSTIAPTPSPNFLQGFVQGFTGQTPGQGASFPMSPGTQIAGGVGQLFNALNQLKNPQQLAMSGLQKLAGGTDTTPAGALPPVVNVPSKPLQGPEAAQTPPGYVQAKAEDPMQALMKLVMLVAAL